MKLLSTLILILATAFSSLAATTWPAGTNTPNQTFYGTNTFLKPLTVNSVTASGTFTGNGGGFVGNGSGLTNVLGITVTNTAATASSLVVSGGTGDFPLALVGFTNGVAKWEKRPKVYRALLTQTDTNAPVATVLENTLGAAITWTYVGPGFYFGTSSISGIFLASKTLVTGQVFSLGIGDGTLAGFNRNDDNSVLISTGVLGNSYNDDVLINQAIEILVYP